MKLVEYGKQNSKVILLLHGGGLSWWNYQKQAELLCDRFRVVLPILDGHAGSDADFAGIEENADRILSYLDEAFGGSVLLIGGLSLGAQVLTELLAKRPDVCRYAIVESASLIPDPLTHALIGPSISASYGLIRRRWFAKLQFRYLRMREDLFEPYYKDSAAITEQNMIAFLQANTAYAPKESLRQTNARVRIVVGSREQPQMLRSARLLHDMLPQSRLEIQKGLYHGEYAVNQAERYAQELLRWIGREETEA